MPETPTPPEIKSSFDMQAYSNEPSVEKRLQMARDYTDRADDAWIAAYQYSIRALNNHSESVKASKREIADTYIHRSTDSVQKEGSVEEKGLPEFVNKFDEWQSTARVLSRIKRIDPENSGLIEYASEKTNTTWNEFVSSLNLVEPLPKGFQSILEYLKQKAENSEIHVVDPNKAEEQTKQRLLDNAPYSAALEMQMWPSEDGTPKHFLIINKHLIWDEINPYEFLMYVAHERGHDFKNSQQTDARRRIEASETVFNEFFPMMEERRLYNLLPQEVRDSLPNTVKNAQDFPEDARAMLEGVLPNLHPRLNLRTDEGLSTLMRAYTHSVDHAIHTGLNLLEKQALSGNTDPSIKKDLEELQRSLTLNPSPVGKPVEWKQITTT